MDFLPLSKRHEVNTFKMTRMYSSITDSSLDETNAMIDSVLAFVSKLENVPTFNLISKGQIIIGYKDQPIQITPDIMLTIDQLDFVKDSGSVEKISITLLSKTITAYEIAAFVKKVYSDHLQELKNSLGDDIYYFDNKPKDTNVNPPLGNSSSEYKAYKRMLIQSSPKQLSFSMTPFYSNKSFQNIYGKEVREIERRVNFFLENRPWYDRKGIPYQLGILLSGISGAGKTSVIRAIANKTKRHIVNVNFATITTATQLKNMFFSDKIQVVNDSANPQTYFIPIHQRLYVLEEIDALGDIVKQRTGSKRRGTEQIPDELTLGEILSVFDGTMEVPGRMIVMTTNHPEVLDQALVRPGRVDVQVHFGAATREFIVEMFKGYMDRDMDPSLFHRLPDRVMSPAEVGQVLFRHFGTEHTDQEIVRDLVREPPPYPDQDSDSDSDVRVELCDGLRVTTEMFVILNQLGFETLPPNKQEEIFTLMKQNGGFVDRKIEKVFEGQVQIQGFASGDDEDNF